MNKHSFYQRILDDLVVLKKVNPIITSTSTFKDFEKDVVFALYTSKDSDEEVMLEEDAFKGTQKDDQGVEKANETDDRSHQEELDDGTTFSEEDEEVQKTNVFPMLDSKMDNLDSKIDELDSKTDNLDSKTDEDLSKDKEESSEDTPHSTTNETNDLKEDNSLKDMDEHIVEKYEIPDSSEYDSTLAEEVSVEEPDIPKSEDNDEDKETYDEDADDDIEAKYEPTEDININASNVPNIDTLDSIDLFKEETEKPLSDFVFHRQIIALTSDANEKRDLINEQMIVTVYPLEPKDEDANTKIFAVVEHNKEFFYVSSYDNENGSSMLQLKVNGYELLIMGDFNNYKFKSRVMTNGLTAQDDIHIAVLDEYINNPSKKKIHNGHIKFTYEAAGNITGTIEIFPLSDESNKTHLFYIRRVDAFVDYGELGISAVTINTSEGNKVINIDIKNGAIIANLVSIDI